MVEDAKSPIVIHRSVNRDGETFALAPLSLSALRSALGAELHVRPRIFLAHETRADYEHVHASIAGHVIQLLTGLTEERLRSLGCGAVTFRDPVTEQDLPRAG